MASSRAFDEVKSILSKLDRRIDEVRARRLQPEPERPAKEPESRPDPEVRRDGGSDGDAPQRLGRARPIPRDGARSD